ncbi:breast carcinoma-amplified sequence 1 isoform X1 [Balaenoptera acutorostrata]|uniref:Breast carcinoma-amplified sequence 1 isoform X1 n=1 Tax=Balaenoptera acutorostrata TaxID=9767 RepID=A0A384ADA0_BALAC|nr:breast carcinoma-amplified sequence 1 isoform X1 [Balaenoptera acutorostrata]
MGNQMSVPQRVEDQENDSEADAHKVASGDECGQNGMPVMVSTRSVQLCHEVDLETSVQEDNVATSSPKTMEISAIADANGENLGKEAKAQTPAAKSRFFLTLSRPVPGRTGDQATDSSTGPVKLDVSSDKALGNKDPSEPMALPVAAALGCDPDKTPVQTPAQAEGLSATWGPESRLSESGGAAPSKPKDSSFFDRLFKLDKGRDEVLVDRQQEAGRAERHHPAAETPGFSTQSDDVPAERDIADGTGKEGQEIPTVSCSVPGVPEELEIAKEDPQTENNNSIMSFFKTLVSPNKAETKKDLEDTASKTESACDGQAGQKTSEIQAKGTKKKHLHSPRLGLAFRKFFRHKGAEKSPATSADLKSDKGNVTPQEPQGAAKNSTSTEIAKEGAKEKGGPTSLPLGKLFWKKSVKEDSVPTSAEENVVCESQVEAVKSEEVESALQTVDLSEEGDCTPEPAEETLKRAERKAPRPSLMALLRQMSVKGDGGITHSEEINGKDSSYQASESTEKAVVPPESEPAAAGQKGKEGASKDRKASAEPEKQKSSKPEAKETAPRAEPAPGEVNSLRDGDKPQKRLEKRRQPLGGFFKGLGPKQMLDAQVQTDPVSIGPVGKSK